MNKCCRRPACGLMTILADITGRKVGRRLAGGLGTIVAGHAGAGDAGMIKSRRGPSAGLVTFFACVAGLQMRCRFSGRLCAVVT